jgi:hypothetical protein
MRRLVLLTVVALVVVSAAPATAKRVVNESYKEFQVQASMWLEGRHASSQGGAWGIDGSNGNALGIQYDWGYDCHNGENGELANISIYGDATLNVGTFVVDPTKGKTKFLNGFAEGMFDEGSYEMSNCDGSDAGSGDLAGMTISIAMDGTGGDLVKTSDSSSWHVPSGSNYHRSDKGLNRMAYGTVVIPTVWEWDGEGSIGRHSWSEHTNE